MKKLFLLIIVSALLFSGCGKVIHGWDYQMIKGDDGNVYRLNRTTGELFVLEGGTLRLVSAEPPSADKASFEMLSGAFSSGMDPSEDYSELEEAKEFGKTQMPGERLWSDFKTSWREGNLFFVFEVFPHSSLEGLYENRKSNYAEFRVSLFDENEFVLQEIRILLTEMQEVCGADGKPEKVVFSSSLPFSAEAYKDIVGYSVWWRLSSGLVPDQK